jgi:hypothetical protein
VVVVVGGRVVVGTPVVVGALVAVAVVPVVAVAAVVGPAEQAAQTPPATLAAKRRASLVATWVGTGRVWHCVGLAGCQHRSAPINSSPQEQSSTCQAAGVVTIDDVREVAADLPRSYEVVVRDRVKFRVGRIVWLAFSRDETEMGFAFPKEEREAFVGAEPHKFLMPGKADLRYNWIEVNLAALDRDEMRELVLDAWALAVPKSVADTYFAQWE